MRLPKLSGTGVEKLFQFGKTCDEACDDGCIRRSDGCEKTETKIKFKKASIHCKYEWSYFPVLRYYMILIKGVIMTKIITN